MRSSLMLLVACALTALVSGCQTGQVNMIVPIAGGGKIEVPLTREGPPPGEADGYRANAATLLPSKTRGEVYYEFGLGAGKVPDLSRIQVDDISDESAESLIDDGKPFFNHNEWLGRTAPIPTTDARLQWIYQITLSFRVYRFTITRKDGRKFTFLHIASYPPFLKTVIRHKLGADY